jgi:diguanylate cyclase (GGDEF)-like protein
MISNVFRWHSLKSRVTLFTLAIFVISIWSLAFYASQMLHVDMKRELGQQQFSSVSVLAAQVNQDLEFRLKALGSIAENLSPALMGNPRALQDLLETRVVFQRLFNGGTFVTGIDGTAIASLPVSVGRVGVNYMERDHVAAALKEGKPRVSKPVIGKLLGSPVVSMAVPIRNSHGKVIGALVGVTDLGKPNFLDKITDSSYGKTGGYLIVARQYRLIVTASDKRRVMETLPAPGKNTLMDHFLQGYEGSEILVNPHGVEILAAVKGIPLADWQLAATLPVAEAFTPIHNLQQRILLATLLLSLLAGGLTWWMLRRQLSPMLGTIKRLAAMSDTSQNLQALPITSQDEIGDLIRGFNHLLEILTQREEKIQALSDMYAALSKCNQDIVRCANEGELFQEICRDVVHFGGMRMAWIGILDGANKRVNPVASFGEGTAYLDGIEVSVDASESIGLGPTGTSIRENRPFWCQDYQHDPAIAAWHERGARFGWKSSASIPLLKNGEVVAAFTLYAGKVNAFNEAVQNLVIEMATNISYALDNFEREAKRKQVEEKVHNLSYYDALTRLPNRHLLMDRLHAALSTSVRRKIYGALISINLDNLKSLNDTLGHEYGNLLLVKAAERIRSCVHELDTVACFGGDEFVVLLEEVDDNSEGASRRAALIAEKIRASLSQPYQLNEHQRYSSSSIGVSLYGVNEDAAEDLLKRANIAMNQVKDAGGNSLRFFDPVMQLALETHAALEEDLRHAVPDQQLQLYYQIQVDGDLRALGAEALVRWVHPRRGMVSPAEFIPISEESSLILDIGGWVMNTACRQLAEWSKSEHTCHLILAVNVSAKQFNQTDFVDKIDEVLRIYKIDASRLKVELTESVVLNDVNDVVAKMHALKALGVRLSIDDFGTGYSSLSYLKKLPLDQIKIDQSFVRDMTSDQNDAVMVKTIIDMATNFRLNVIAEGVETEAQMSLLKHLGCMSYQGYFFSKPVPIEKFDKLLKQT